MRQILVFAGVFLFFGVSISPTWALSASDEPLVKVVDKTLPAVVNITAEKVIIRQGDPYDLFFGRYYGRTEEQRVHSLGSGVFVSPDGYIVTCAHVVDRAENGVVKISLSNGGVYQAKVVRADPDLDLALLKVLSDGKDPFHFVDTAAGMLSPNLLGETVVALGNPVGYQSSVSQGILSAKNRTIQTEQGTSQGLLQTDAAINPGNSGGPLVDIEGKLVGICSDKYVGEAVESIGFAIPGEVVSGWVSDSIAIDKGLKEAPKPVALPDVIQAHFGISLQELTPELAESFNLQTTDGLLVADVEKGGPADRANIKPGMLLIRIGNVPVYSMASLPRQLSRIKAGDEVSFTLAITEQRGSLIIQRSGTATLEAK